MRVPFENRGSGDVATIIAAMFLSAALVFVGLQLKDLGKTARLAAGGMAQVGDIGAGGDVVGIAAPMRPGAAGGNGGAPEFNQAKLKTSFGGDHIYGAKTASSTLVVYMDFQCPYCVKYYPVAKQFVDQSGGKVNLVLRHYPLDFHSQADTLASAAECVADQRGDTGFWSFADKIFLAPKIDYTSDAFLAPIVASLNVDATQYSACMKQRKFAARIQAFADEAKAVGVTGTPSSVLYDAQTSHATLIPGVAKPDQLQASLGTLLARN